VSSRLRLFSIATIATVGALVPLQQANGAASQEPRLDQPHLIDDEASDVLVRLTDHVCTGTPITGTVYVVTAAHCVLTEQGEVRRRTVVRNHIWYPAVAVLVNTDYAKHTDERLDVAVLVMSQVIPGPSARVGTSVPTTGQLTLAGYQPINRNGTLLRAHYPSGRPPTNAPYRPAACVESAQSLEVSAKRVTVPCGLVGGASGGGLFTEEHGELVLVGILSTVTSDLLSNGVAPLAALRELLDHPDVYAHGF